jgi:hypothetical protein
MFGRFSRSTAIVGFVLSGLALTSASALCAQQNEVSPAPRPPAAAPSERRPPLSPLHAFLGIDPITGEFKPPGAVSHQGAAPAASTPAGPNEAEPSPTEPLVGEVTLDDFRSSIAKAIDEGNDEALATALANLTRGTGYDGLSLVNPQLERLGYLILFLYPLGIVLSEIYGVWARRDTRGRGERERRHFSRQLRRRLTLAAFSTTTICLFWYAAEHRFWWNEPERLFPILGTLALLLASSALLRLVIARAARDYPMRVIEDLRMQQTALENEIKELRRRLQGDRIVEPV